MNIIDCCCILLDQISLIKINVSHPNTFFPLWYNLFVFHLYSSQAQLILTTGPNSYIFIFWKLQFLRASTNHIICHIGVTIHVSFKMLLFSTTDNCIRQPLNRVLFLHNHSKHQWRYGPNWSDIGDINLMDLALLQLLQVT